MHHQQHYRHFYQHAHHRGQRRAGLEAEQADGGGDGQFEEVARADQGRRASNVVGFTETPIEPIGQLELNNT